MLNSMSLCDLVSAGRDGGSIVGTMKSAGSLLTKYKAEHVSSAVPQHSLIMLQEAGQDKSYTQTTSDILTVFSNELVREIRQKKQMS